MLSQNARDENLIKDKIEVSPKLGRSLVRGAERKKDIECKNKDFVKLDSGKTVTTLPPKEERNEEIKEDEWVDHLPEGEEDKEKNESIIKNEEQKEEIKNVLREYLNYIESPLTRILRPKLPVPFKSQKQVILKAPDLFIWTKNCNK